MSVLFSFLFHISYFVSLHVFSEEHLLSSSYLEITPLVLGFPGGIVVKDPSVHAGVASTRWLGRSSREGNGNPFQYSCLGNPMNKGAWWPTVHDFAKSWT